MNSGPTLDEDAPRADAKAPGGGSAAPGRSRVPWWRARGALAVALIFAAIQALLATSTALDKSETMDEPVYISLAWRQWHGELSCAPVLPLWAFGAAQRAVDPAMAKPPSTPLAQRGNRGRLSELTDDEYRRDLRAARGATIGAVVLAGLLLWSAARRFGDRAAAATHAIWCFSPLVLAHGALAALDAWVAAGMCVVLWSAVRGAERPSRPRAAVAGGALALAACAKVTALVAAPVMIGVVAWAAREGRSRAPAHGTSESGNHGARDALALIGSGLGGFALVVWVLYAFRLAPVGADAMGAPFDLGWLGRHVPVPAPEWAECLVVQLGHGYEKGHAGYLFGQAQSRGWWWFYLASIALQTTIAAQAVAVFRAGAAIVRPPARAELLVDAALLAFPALLVVALSAARTQNGLRYLLPAWPCLAMLGGRAVLDVDRLTSGRAKTLARFALAAVLALGAASMLAVHPHHLMYFNAWAGGPEGGPRYLVQGSDWGQDARRLGEWQERNGIPVVYYVPYTMVPNRWKIRSAPPPCPPRPGVYALHAVHLFRPPEEFAPCTAWLAGEPPDERIGYSIYIYRVDWARLRRLLGKPAGSADPGAREP